jgi:hypothetical protein
MESNYLEAAQNARSSIRKELSDSSGVCGAEFHRLHGNGRSGIFLLMAHRDLMQ